ncbi:MAG TPA: DUF4013 domain-containing protein [Methanocorpusculum sp.]|nr:DUF4013 domain-containing protein [Methanocorpusculum sp.]
MVIHFGENIDASIQYANTALKGFGNWFILILLNTLMFIGVMAVCVGTVFMILGGLSQSFDNPSTDFQTWAILFGTGGSALLLGLIIVLIMGILLMGLQIRVFRGGELNFANFGRFLRDGFFGFVIAFLYMVPYILVTILTALGPVANPVYFIFVCVIIPTLIIIASLLFELTALVHFAKNGTFASAFQFKEIYEIILKIGVLRYIGNLCLIGLIIFAVEMILVLIPFAGMLLFPVVLGFILLVQSRFIANMYETALEEPAGNETVPEEAAAE